MEAFCSSHLRAWHQQVLRKWNYTDRMLKWKLSREVGGLLFAGLAGWLAESWRQNWASSQCSPRTSLTTFIGYLSTPTSLALAMVSWTTFSGLRPHLILPKNINAVTSLSFLGILLSNNKYPTLHPDHILSINFPFSHSISSVTRTSF